MKKASNTALYDKTKERGERRGERGGWRGGGGSGLLERAHKTQLPYLSIVTTQHRTKVRRVPSDECKGTWARRRVSINQVSVYIF